MEDTCSPETIHLEFSDKYDCGHAQHYFRKHRRGLFHRLTTWREQAMARRALALAGDPEVLLDLPCGAGRFWPLLAENPRRRILAADYSQDMIQVACRMHPAELVRRVECFRCSAFETGLDDDSVDSVFCMRLLHHIIDPSHRLALLREFHRITRDTVCISLWVDGNYQAFRRIRRDLRQSRGSRQNRGVVARRTVEGEFRQAGFEIQGCVDFLKLYSMWRLYVLRKGGRS